MGAIMKKVILLMMLIFTMAVLSQCGDDEVQPDTEVNTLSEQQKAEMVQRENTKKELEGKMEHTMNKAEKFYKLYKKYKGSDQKKAVRYYKLYRKYKELNEEAKAKYDRL